MLETEVLLNFQAIKIQFQFNKITNKKVEISVINIIRIILIAPCAVEVCYVRTEVCGIRSNVLNLLQM